MLYKVLFFCEIITHLNFQMQKLNYCVTKGYKLKNARLLVIFYHKCFIYRGIIINILFTGIFLIKT